jgi:peptidoglycan L-alanyl-D-glutamate endopeptidase CwlK
VDRDPKKLVPAFGWRIEKIFRAMRARGFEPMLWEGYRTPARASELAARGTGISDSLHAYGIAVDVVDGKQWAKGKDPWAAETGFWAALGEEAEREGLTWGGRFSKPDRTHIQGVTVAEQSAARAATAVERARMVA